MYAAVDPKKYQAKRSDILIDFLKKEDATNFQLSKQIMPLTPEQKREIFKSVRYSFMTHQQLMKLLDEKGFEEAKDFIREGISFRLNSYENDTTDLQYSINTKPRECYLLPDLVIADLENESI